MTIRNWSAVLLCGVFVAIAGVERRHHRRSDAPAAVPPTAAASDRTFTDTSGICIRYPASWRSEKARTAVLAVEAPPTLGCVCLCLDVPVMSWHPPFIPISMVAKRYVEALRQGALPDAQIQETADLTVPGASARRVRARGHEKGQVRLDDAVVLVHGGQIFILSTDSDEAGGPAARAALDAAVASIQWRK